VTTGISRLCEMPDGWILPKEMMRTTVALSVLLCRSLPTSSFMTTVFTENSKASLIACKAIMEWFDLARAALDVVPEALVTSTPRVAKDSDYAGAVQKIWKQEQSTKQVSEFCRHRYETVEVDVPTRGTTRNKWQIVLLLSSQSVGGSLVQECLASCDHLTNL
jgi:hypothetical protein